MFIGTHHQRLTKLSNIDLDLIIENNPLQRVKSCKHLGVIIDEHLSWEQQVDNVKCKVLPGLYYLKKIFRPYS